MRTILTTFIIVFMIHPMMAQKSVLYEITAAGDGLYHLYYDSSELKSTVVEFENFIALLEVPIKDEGGGATNLKDHADGGRRVLNTLRKKFPGKPLKYVLHTHWHPHSISSVKPFLASGATFISTQSNFERLKGFVSAEDIRKYREKIRFVEADSLVIADLKNRIVAYRFLKKDFPSTPTEEYLYFYLPKYKALHSGCMFIRFPQLVEGKEILTERVSDVNSFLTAKNIQPSCFIRFNGDKGESNGMVSYAKFQGVLERGISLDEINLKYFSVSEQTLQQRRDSVLEVIVRNNVPAFICNNAVYACLRKKELSKALSLAQLQVMIAPVDPNSWDTLGEVYYFLGETEMALYYEKMTRKIDAGFTAGGEAVWKADLESYQKRWN
ncbi:MAG: hypothetical protein ACOYXT_03265 [Bacteroidota bacterium]